MADESTEGLKNWGGGTKTARPTSVGPHDRKADQEDPGNPGLSPEADYKPGPGTNEGNSASTGAAKPEMVAGAGVKPADHIEPGKERDAPPLTGTATE